MEKIVLEVDNDTARKWQYIEPEAKQRITEEMRRFLKTLLTKRKDDLWPFLEKLREEAEKKGFNDTILNDIINEE
jgi:hypothetical protein